MKFPKTVRIFGLGNRSFQDIFETFIMDLGVFKRVLEKSKEFRFAPTPQIKYSMYHGMEWKSTN